MSVASTGQFPYSGSVFYMDTYNNKSYVGEPTTNYQWNSGNEITPWTVGGTNTDVTNTLAQGPVLGAKTWKFQKSGTSNQWNGWESSYGGIWTGNSGDVWTTSYWYKTFSPAGNTNFGVGAYFTSDWSRQYNTTILASDTSIIADGRWHYGYAVTQFNENYSNAIIVDGPSWGYSYSAGELYINGLQWEKKSHPTPFAYGTRSNTQGLLDLTKNSTIDLTNMVYDSSASLNFPSDNSRNTYFTVSNTTNLTGDVTLTAWVKPVYNLSSTPHKTIVCTHPTYQYGAKLMNYKNYARWGMWLGFGNDNYEAFVGDNVNDNTYKMLTSTWTKSTGVVVLYLNGAVRTTITTGKANTNLYYDATSIQVGVGYETAFGNGQSYEGKIDSTAIYNRALSSDEVLKIYNRTKKRYGY